MSKHDVALLTLRLVAGVIFVMHGYGKLFGNAPGMEMFTKMVAGLHFPMPVVFAYLAACSEFFGGLALLLGLAPRVASFFLAVVMLVAFFGAKGGALPKGDVDLALLAIVLALGLLGHGKYALSTKLQRNKTAPAS